MIITQFMLDILERLADMFPKDSYQSRLESYLKSRGANDAASIENYIKEFERKSIGGL